MAVVAASVVLSACTRAERPTHLQAETTFLAPYVSVRSGSCEGRAFQLALSNRPAYVIATLPAIEESGWELTTTCNDDMKFVLDCRQGESGFFCTAHEWPFPIDAQKGNELSHELAAVMEVAPRCPREKSCLRERNACAEDGVVIRRFADRYLSFTSGSIDYAAGFYEVERCGLKRTVNVSCQRRDPFACAVSTRDE